MHKPQPRGVIERCDVIIQRMFFSTSAKYSDSIGISSHALRKPLIGSESVIAVCHLNEVVDKARPSRGGTATEETLETRSLKIPVDQKDAPIAILPAR